MVRNPRLPVDLVKKYVGVELGKAMQNGRLYTAKELGEVEEKVYAEINLRVSHGEQLQCVLESNKFANYGGGIFNTAEKRRNQDQGKKTAGPSERYARIAVGASARGPFRGNPHLSTRDHIQSKVIVSQSH